MANDPIIQELRDIRKEIENECDKKGQTYYDHLWEIQEHYQDKLVEDFPRSQNSETKKRDEISNFPE